MNIVKTLVVAALSVGLVAIQPAATAGTKSNRAQSHQVVKKAKPAVTRVTKMRVGGKKSNFFQRIASTPREFFKRHSGPVVRHRNEGVPPEAYANVPRPVVSENSVF